jgi:hypothetical protein
MDRTDEISKEGICYQCGEKKYIKWYQGSKIFCEDCWEKEARKRTEKD